jgi:hypothetical protein
MTAHLDLHPVVRFVEPRFPEPLTKWQRGEPWGRFPRPFVPGLSLVARLPLQTGSRLGLSNSHQAFWCRAKINCPSGAKTGLTNLQTM